MAFVLQMSEQSGITEEDIEFAKVSAEKCELYMQHTENDTEKKWTTCTLYVMYSQNYKYDVDHCLNVLELSI